MAHPAIRVAASAKPAARIFRDISMIARSGRLDEMALIVARARTIREEAFANLDTAWGMP
ncbi:hypothetical protein GCM10011390_39150 [Aureimonas endophytica]|uniref:Uncharacterized protein n=1 Tax=Aureimonas endophytica TaxID=2027858 RepID=A0A916ZVQ8_9HYPH|nr:hypothetical protein GCM10011390_39150 [Aureimonas endophytica]